MRSYVSAFAAWISAYPAELHLETQKLTAGPGRTKGLCSYSCPAQQKTAVASAADLLGHK